MIDAHYYETLPKKRMAVGALFLDEQKNILVVKPTYRPYWLLPGGVVEENESPRQACIREVKEELNLDVPVEALLCIEYLPQEDGKNEYMQFVFYGGILSQTYIQRIVLPTAELSEYRFLPLEQALMLLSTKLAKRMPYCLQALEKKTVVYLESGQEAS